MAATGTDLTELRRRCQARLEFERRNGRKDAEIFRGLRKVPGLLDFYERVSRYTDEPDRPVWMLPYTARLETAIGANMRLAFAAPPQHGKTAVLLRAFLYWAEYFPGYRHAYVTYNLERARAVAFDFITLARELGYRVTGTLAEVTVNEHTTIRFGSGGLTGYALDGVCAIDDPIKDREAAFSKTIRDKWRGWWRSTARVRRHPGTSFLIMATRWHTEDPTGYLVREEKFDYVNLKAIAEPADNDDVDIDGHIIRGDPLHRAPGEALWSHKPPSFFEEDRRDRYTWASMFQGEPVPAGGSVFHQPGEVDAAGNPAGPGFYRELPTADYRGAFGIDLAYTAKTRADWSICIEGWAVQSTLPDGKKRNQLYIVDVVRKQVEATSFALALKAKKSKRPTWPIRWYVGGQEATIGDFMRRQGIKIECVPAVAEKFIRALGVAAAWNAGDVLLPDTAFPIKAADGTTLDTSWLPDFVEVVCNFRGDNKERDDDVDALAAVFDQLMRASPAPRGVVTEFRVLI